MRSILAVTTTAALLLAACGGSDDDSGDAAPSEESSGDSAHESAGAGDSNGAGGSGPATTYRGELEDESILTVELDVAESDPAVAPFAAFRETTGATDPVVWITASVEVPAGVDGSGRYLTFVEPGAEPFDEDGTAIADFACAELDTWFGTPTGDDATAVNEAYLGIFENACGGQVLGVVAPGGATTDYVLALAGSELPTFDRVLAGLLTELEPVG